MNALVKKEIRLLFPSWAICFVSALPAWFIAGDLQAVSGSRFFFLIVLPFFLCPALVVIMALDSFGREISAGTFSSLLAQPISRSRIWWTKTLLLAAAMIILWVAWWFSLIHNKILIVPLDSHNKLHELFVAAVLFPIAVYSGGLWTVLLLRQVAAAFWFTLLIPAALAIGTMSRMAKYPDAVESALIIALSLYSLAGFLFARWLFLRAQDVQWSGGLIALPEIPGLSRFKIGSTARRTSRVRAALFAKEFQLHQSQFVLAGVLALVHVGVVLLRKFGGDFSKQPAMELILAGFWTLWMAMPLLIGCAAVAEERKLGTLETQLCLPVRRRTQFAIKLFVALLLSIFLAVIMPFLIEGRRIFPDFQTAKPGGGFDNLIAQGLGILSVAMPFLFVAGIAFILFMVSFYASTLSRNTLQSLAPAVLGIVVTWVLLLGAPAFEKVFHNLLWRGWLIYLIGVPVMALTLLALMYWSFKHVIVGWRVWSRNGIVLVASLAFVIGITAAIYHRAWELFMRLEPAHGAARLSRAQGVMFRGFDGNLSIRLPDGRAWARRYLFTVPKRGELLTNQPVEIFPGGRFLPGSNWTSLAFGNQEIAAVQSDGSLWVVEQRENRKVIGQPTSTTNSQPFPLVRLGPANDWKSVADRYALKTNGTIWKLGRRSTNLRLLMPPFVKPNPADSVGLRNYEPTQLGTDSDWAELSAISYSSLGTIVFRKSDGQTWADRGPVLDPKSESLRLDDETSVTHSSFFNADEWRDWAWVFGGNFLSFQAGVRKDGTLRIFANWQFPSGKISGEIQLAKLDVQLGKDSDWVAMACGEGIFVTLKADGSLWKWDFPDDPVTNPDSASVNRLSRRSDWMGIVGDVDGVITLAADGTLWRWQFDSRTYRHSDRLLAPSRKPQKIGNIFDAPRVP